MEDRSQIVALCNTNGSSGDRVFNKRKKGEEITTESISWKSDRTEDVVKELQPDAITG